jgi:hypothetical protein
VFATHHFPLGDTTAAYDTFADAATTDELKVVLSGTEVPADEASSRVASAATT